jgi:hypothetical protein
MSHTMRQRVRLARAGTGYDKQRRRVAMLDGMALFWVKPVEVRCCCHADKANRQSHQQARLLIFLQISHQKAATFAIRAVIAI